MLNRILISLCLSISAFSQTGDLRSLEKYSPDGSSFTISVPGKPLPAQGHVFPETGSRDVFALVEKGKDYRVFNFEVNVDGKRGFLASILQVKVDPIFDGRFLSRAQIKALNIIIGDEIIMSEVKNVRDQNDFSSQWFYGREFRPNNPCTADGVVTVIRSRKLTLIAVIAFDHINPCDHRIAKMLESFRSTI